MTKPEIISSQINSELANQQQRGILNEASARRVIELRKSLVGYYSEFIRDNINSFPGEFRTIEKYPTTEVIRSYFQYGNPRITDDILLYEYGWFDIKELAVIIKELYSLKRNRDYRLMTLGNYEVEYKGPLEEDKRIVPYVNLLIGSDKGIEFLDKYNGLFLPDDSQFSNLLGIFSEKKHQDLARLKQRATNVDFGLGSSIVDNSFIYQDSDLGIDSNIYFSSRYNIFDKYFGEIIRRLNDEPRRNIGGILSFSLDVQDNFIAKALMSIVIYKKKINKKILDNDDYKDIFYKLFKVDIDISDKVDEYIPKRLIKKVI